MADTAPADRPGSPGTRVWLKHLALTLPFAGFFLIQLAHHQMWRDEVNAFGLAVASPNLSLLLHYVHYEGHPWLWYVMLWCVSRVTVSVVGMKCLQAAIGLGIYGMLGLASPFRTWEKLLLFLGYFVSFEYTVMSRMYGLLLLLALVYVRRRALHPDRIYGNAALLGLIACTDLAGMVVSFGLLCEYAFVVFQSRQGRAHREPLLLPAAPRTAQLIGAGVVYACMLLSAVLSLLPAKDISRSSTAGLLTLATNTQQLGKVVVSYLVKPYFPDGDGPRRAFLDPVHVGSQESSSACAYHLCWRRTGSSFGGAAACWCWLARHAFSRCASVSLSITAASGTSA